MDTNFKLLVKGQILQYRSQLTMVAGLTEFYSIGASHCPWNPQRSLEECASALLSIDSETPDLELLETFLGGIHVNYSELAHRLRPTQSTTSLHWVGVVYLVEIEQKLLAISCLMNQLKSLRELEQLAV